MRTLMKAISRILAAIMILSTLSVSAIVVKAAASSGTCGDDLTWMLDSDGVLTVSGSGDMYVYRGDAPWSYMPFTSVVIEEGVTSITYNAFAYSDNLKNVYIPTTVNYIGEYAFVKCPALTDIYYAGNSLSWELIDIDERSFYNVNIVCLDTSNTLSGTCGDDLTWTLDSDGVLTVSGTGDIYAYQADAPWNGMHFTAVVIEEGVTGIGAGAFSSSRYLNTVTIPLSVNKIGDFAFSKCPAIDVYYAGNMADWAKVDMGIMPLHDDTVMHYGKTEENISGALGDNITWTLMADGTLTVSGNGDIPNAYSSVWEKYNVKEVIIEKGITGIGSHAFAKTSLSSIVIPNTVTYIGEDAFYMCPNLLSVNIPSSVEVIGELAFYACHSLGEIKLHEGLKAIEDFAFYRCESLGSISIPSSMEKLGNDALAIGYSPKIFYFGTEEAFNSIGYDAINSDSILYFISRGDVNGDGTVNSKDSNMIKRAVLGRYVLSDNEFAAADINSDGSITTADLFLMKKQLIG